MKRHLRTLAFSIAALAMIAGQIQAALPTLVREINSPPPINSSNFGFSFGDFNGNLLVGSPDFFNNDAAYLMNLNTGAKLVTMTSPDAGKGMISFGGSIAQVGQNIVVGDYEYDASSSIVRTGSAYMFNGSTGQFLFPIRNPNPQNFDHFSTSMSEIGGNLWINSQSDSGNSSGRIHIFNSNNGQLIRTLTSPEPAGNWGFGYKFLEHGNDVFVSAIGGSFAHLHAGAIFRYDKTTLELKQKIYNPFPTEEGNFGWALAQDNNRLLVGAPGYSSPSTYSVGQAYLYSEKTGGVEQIFVNPEPKEFASFGRSVALAGNYAFIGGPSADSGGAFYVYDVNSGAYLGKVVNPHPEQGSNFTNGWGIDGGLIAIGDKVAAAAYLNNLGSAYIYSIPLAAGQAVPIPEPSSVALLMLGAVGLALHARRKFGGRAK